MEDFTDENRMFIKMLGGPEKLEYDFRNNKKAVLRISRLLKQIKLDRNGKEHKDGVTFKDMKNKDGDSQSTLKRQNAKWNEEKK